VEVADIFRAQGKSFIDRHRNHMRFQQRKVMQAIVRCRTAALGGHIDVCLRCGKDWGLSFNSCRNRHCPKCQAQARQRWIVARKEELLETRYFHVVFTLPHELHSLILQNEAELYNLLFRAVADTLLEVAANPEHLGAEIGFFGILHTWGQNLLLNPHS
jgi:Transposase zinc-binding domain